MVQVETLQRRDRTLRQIMTNDPDRNYKRKIFEQRSIIFYKNRIYIPEPLRITSTIRWYHHYLCHPGKHVCIKPCPIHYIDQVWKSTRKVREEV